MDLLLSITVAFSIRYNDVPGRYAYTYLVCRNSRVDSLAQCIDVSEGFQVHDTCTIARGVICEGNYNNRLLLSVLPIEVIKL